MNVHDYFGMYDKLRMDHTLSASDKFEMVEAKWKADHGARKLSNLSTFFSCRTRYIKKQISLMRSS